MHRYASRVMSHVFAIHVRSRILRMCGCAGVGGGPGRRRAARVGVGASIGRRSAGAASALSGALETQPRGRTKHSGSFIIFRFHVEFITPRPFFLDAGISLFLCLSLILMICFIIVRGSSFVGIHLCFCFVCHFEKHAVNFSLEICIHVLVYALIALHVFRRCLICVVLLLWSFIHSVRVCYANCHCSHIVHLVAIILISVCICFDRMLFSLSISVLSLAKTHS